MFLHVMEIFRRTIGIVQISPYCSQNRIQDINRKIVNIYSLFHISRVFCNYDQKICIPKHSNLKYSSPYLVFAFYKFLSGYVWTVNLDIMLWKTRSTGLGEQKHLIPISLHQPGKAKLGCTGSVSSDQQFQISREIFWGESRICFFCL